MIERRERPLRVIALAALWALAACLLTMLLAPPGGDTLIGRPLEQAAQDLRWTLRGPEAPPQKVVIVAANDATAADAGGWPAPRAYLAKALDGLREAGATAVGVDLLLLDQRASADGAQAFKDALARWGEAVVCAGAPIFATASGTADQGVTAADAALDPSSQDGAGARLRRVAQSGYATVLRSRDATPPKPVDFLLPSDLPEQTARIGHVGIGLRGDGRPEGWPLAVPVGEAYAPSMALELLRADLRASPGGVMIQEGVGVALGDRMLETDPFLSRRIWHYGPSSSFRRIALEDAANGRLAPGSLEGSVAVIGVAGMSGVGATFATPFDTQTPGVAVIATTLGNLLTGDRVIAGAAAAPANFLALALAALFCALWSQIAPLRFAAIGFAVACALWVGLGQWLFQADGLMLSPASLLAGGLATLAVFASRHSRIRAFWRQGRRITAVILFADLANSTSGAETQGDSAASRRIARFHELFEQAVRDAGGVVAGWSGDAALAIFETDGSGARLRALAAAQLLAGMPDETLRVSLHYGDAELTKLGRSANAPVTPIGDAVNVAARLLDVAKEEGATLVISDAAYQALAERGVTAPDGLIALPPQALRGRSAPIGVWKLAS